jgi:ubiquitin conjugation factor E4 B
VRQLLFHKSLWRAEGLGGGDASWRGIVCGLEALVSVKSISVMITGMPEWIPANVTAASFERVTLLGPLCRLGVFEREWVNLCEAMLYFISADEAFTAIHCQNILLTS